MSTDPIADMLTIIRNAMAVDKHQVQFPYSRVKEEIVKILQQQGYIESYEVIPAPVGRRIAATLYKNELGFKLHAIDRVSKPGRRMYAKKDEIPSVLSGRGMVLISTSGGLMTGQEARRKGLGGELICKVW